MDHTGIFAWHRRVAADYPLENMGPRKRIFPHMANPETSLPERWTLLFSIVFGQPSIAVLVQPPPERIFPISSIYAFKSRLAPGCVWLPSGHRTRTRPWVSNEGLVVAVRRFCAVLRFMRHDSF